MRESGERIVLRLVLGARTFVHLEHEVHGDEEWQDARSGEHRRQLRRLARRTLHREQRRREQRQPQRRGEPSGPSRGGRTAAWLTRRRSDGMRASRGPEAHTGEPENLDRCPTGIWSTPSDPSASTASTTSRHASAPAMYSDSRRARNVRGEQGAVPARPAPRRRAAGATPRRVASGARSSIRSAPQVTNASAATHMSASKTTPSARPGARC